MSTEIREEVRESWGTRTGFILAAVGSAVGLGNLWGFPYKLYNYGGAAFLIPYLIALILVGIPMMILEFSLGHHTQRAAPDAYGKLNKRFELVGWWGILLGFVIITYYPVILAYCMSFLWYSAKGIFSGGQLPWAGEGVEGVNNAKEFFFSNYLGHEDTFKLGPIQGHIVVALLATWVAMYLCICKGVKLVGKVVWLTVPIPWIMLLILTVRGLTLPGSLQGLAFYLNPEWSELAKPTTWRFAFGQVFFSLSLAFGVMITYASFLHRKSDINNNAAIISLTDLATSFVAGLAIFATIGGMAYATQQAGQHVPVKEVISGGPGLAFVAFPYALAQLPYSAWFSFMFFLALVTLGIDSAFSITESVLASIVDKTGWHRNIVLPVLSVIGLSMGLVYTTQGGGLNWLGTVDGFINGTWGIAFMGLVECVVLGWLYRTDVLRQHANERSDWKLGKWWTFFIRVAIPIVLGALVVWSMFDDLSAKGGFIMSPLGDPIWPNILGLSVVIAVPIISIVMSMMRSVRTEVRTKPLPRKESREGIAAIALGSAGAVLLAFAFSMILAMARAEGTPETVAGTPATMLGIAMALGVVGIALSNRAVVRDTTETSDPSWLVRWSGILSTVGVGASVGLFLALQSLRPTDAAPPAIDTETAAELTGTAYVLLAVIAIVLIGGLAWCFYRAAMAASARQQPDPA